MNGGLPGLCPPVKTSLKKGGGLTHHVYVTRRRDL